MTRLLSECDLYNEVDPSAVTWLGQLIADGHLPDGRIESDSIEDVLPTELAQYRHAHFFAGIGGWPLALKLAGWPSGIHTWTGSCPCQPFSAAGKGAGFTDPRHLWPAWYWHICQCLPDVIFGEQVASPDGYAWLDVVQDGLEDAGYAVGATVTPAAGYGAPHARHRIYFAAVRLENGQLPESARQRQLGGQGLRLEAAGGPARTSLVDELGSGRGNSGVLRGEAAIGELANADGTGWQSRKQAAAPARHGGSSIADGGFAGPMPGPVNGFWKSADWLRCRGDKWRPVEPGTQPLVDGNSSALVNVLSFCRIAAERINDYGARSQTDPDKVLRMVRGSFQQVKGWKEPATGVRGEFYASPVLLDFMLSQAAACDRTANGSGIKKAGKVAVAGALRIMRMDGRSMRSSHRREPDEQRPIEPANTLHELSFLLARDTQAFGSAVLKAHASVNRVGLLRGYGNAIVIPQAVAFVETVMDVLGITGGREAA